MKGPRWLPEPRLSNLGAQKPKAGPGGAARRAPSISGHFPSQQPLCFFPGSVQAGGKAELPWLLSGCESFARSDFALLSNFLASAREIGACGKPPPWPEEPAEGRRQEEKNGSATAEPTRPLPSLREPLQGVCACCEPRVRVQGRLCGCARPGGGGGGRALSAAQIRDPAAKAAESPCTPCVLG